ncbi:hypothetical protein INT08_02075 [Prosthecochloris sp. N3]|uniref:Metallo-beta-lactamase domain-containing protein n=1 Tax=Prosthecochloris ethylica TaxID=2743976 RepID=A0ABR9XPL4_9CHLB|nr:MULTISPECIES: hypothetical protein [Prosthecochloris]MBF0586267.1 hypothetical protein [Prosthecochloris ethylica]MBF0635973.1 hypothetical protein [Prosthecochloris ethylica]NUK47352.1 hypothetical protein [Prosthecochloris ethylica]RNA64908.1 hypothetical protein CR163_006505 [Prosthecochloris sp. ZM_2]
MHIEIIGTESLGVRGMCCLVTSGERHILIDPGVSLGYRRHGLLPHPVQVMEGRRVRKRIQEALEYATDIVFSHYHGDHVPLNNANPYQLSFMELPATVPSARYWGAAPDDLSEKMMHRYQDLHELLGEQLHSGSGRSAGPLTFSPPVVHGDPIDHAGSVMMTRVELDGVVFAHGSDIQLLDERAIDILIDWEPDILFAAGPPLYLDRLHTGQLETARHNAWRLLNHVDTVILDHHLMRSCEGVSWLESLIQETGRTVYCGAAFLHRPKRLLEAEREELYRKYPVAEGWHENYARQVMLERAVQTAH